jgi:hypothetical protein
LSLHGAALITLIIKSRDCLEKCDVSLGSVEQYLVHTTTDNTADFYQIIPYALLHYC